MIRINSLEAENVKRIRAVKIEPTATGLTVVGVYDPFYARYEDELRGLCHRYIHSFTELLE